ncbi:hypothetical protein GCM10011578_008300 [Streptomyces fuscichromogenes]|uniref:Uncharacterized protein n=1 Tax=Streptomyces fuscichromogenes TaxID=1324013 RepID=A0A917UIY4_9ACTN|nr:hypothetical protein GCM10011578_008300 [Streptomyces fuscichromogenes]
MTATVTATTAVLLAGTVALAPGAAAVTPTQATTQYDCDLLGWTNGQLTATQTGSYVTITIQLSVTAPLAVPWYSIPSTLVLDDINTGRPVYFAGTVNPPISTGDPIVLGPLPGVVDPGESLDAYGQELTFQLYGIRISCEAVSPLSPGPFTF